jgi:hypothetical protein
MVARRLEKITILDKVAETVAKPKNAKISSSKLNVKVQNICIKPLLNSLNASTNYISTKNITLAFKK